MKPPSGILPAFPKPSQKEGKVALTPAQRRKKKAELFNRQKGRCAKCDCALTWRLGYNNTAELDHVKPEPMGAKKRDNDDNLCVLCWACNRDKGSKRG